MKSKAQIQGQVFIYILAMILIALTLIYGYNAIKDFGDRANKVALLTFKTDLEADVKTIMTDYGTVKKQVYDVPGERVCFVDLSKGYLCDKSSYDEIPKICNADVPEFYDPIIKNLWLSSTEQNVFVLPESDITIKTIAITIDGNNNGIEDTDDSACISRSNDCYYICSEIIGGRITLRMEGRGDHTFVSLWTE